jgi:hypothetical protein
VRSFSLSRRRLRSSKSDVVHEWRALGSVYSAVVTLHHPLGLLVRARPDRGILTEPGIPALSVLLHESSHDEKQPDHGYKADDPPENFTMIATTTNSRNNGPNPLLLLLR